MERVEQIKNRNFFCYLLYATSHAPLHVRTTTLHVHNSFPPPLTTCTQLQFSHQRHKVHIYYIHVRIHVTICLFFQTVSPNSLSKKKRRTNTRIFSRELPGLVLTSVDIGLEGGRDGRRQGGLGRENVTKLIPKFKASICLCILKVIKNSRVV